MTRSAALIRDSPNATGDCDWIDVVNNWRDADATWLQERSIVRVTTTPEAETALANTNQGRVFYSISEGVLYISTAGTSPFSRVLSSTKLLLDESVPGFVTVGIDGFESAGITFNITNGSVTIGELALADIVGTSLDVGAAEVDSLEVGIGGITINTDGTHTTHFTTGDLGLLIDTSISATGFVRGAQGEFSSVTVSGTGAFATVTASATVTAATSVITPKVRAAASSDMTIEVQSGQAVRFTSPTVAGASFYYGAGSTIRLGWVVVSNVDPGVATVPEGTIWINPSL